MKRYMTDMFLLVFSAGNCYNVLLWMMTDAYFFISSPCISALVLGTIVISCGWLTSDEVQM